MTENSTEVNQFTEGDPLQPNGVNQDVNHVKPKRNCCETCKFVLKNVTVEPTMVLFVLGSILSQLASQNLSLEKACRVNLQFPDEICRSIKLQEMESQNEYEKEIQKLVAKFLSLRTLVSVTIPCVIALLAGSYCDKSGRKKVFLIIPIIGQMLICVNNILNTYFFYQLNLEFLTFSEAFIEGLSGGWSLPFFIMFAYICTITTTESRTFRMGLLSFALNIGFPIGMALSGVLLQTTGYYGCYGVSLGCQTINLIYNICFLKDPPKSPEQKKHINNGAAFFCRAFFSLANIKESFQVMFRSGPNKRRLRMIVYLLVIITLFGPVMGLVSVLYLNTRFRFNWDEVQFSVFQTYNFITSTIGTIFSITVFSKIFGWHDSILGIISTVSKIAGSFVYCFAPTGKIFYIAPMVELLNGTATLAMRSLISKLVAPNELVPVVELLNATTFTSLRSIISKLVEKQETAKVNSLFSLTETVANLMFHPFYSWMYMKTLHFMSGAVFLVSAALIIPASIILIIFYVQHRKELGKARKKALEAEEKIEAEVKKIDILSPYYIPETIEKLDFSILKNSFSLTENKDNLKLRENEVDDDVTNNVDAINNSQDPTEIVAGIICKETSDGPNLSEDIEINENKRLEVKEVKDISNLNPNL